MFVTTLIVFSEADDIRAKYPTTALAALVGGAPSLTSEVSALWRNEVLDPTSAHVEDFVASIPGNGGSLTLVLTPNIETEALLRMNRANAVGSSQPCQEGLSSQAPPRARREVATLRPGGLLVTSTNPANGGLLLPIEEYTLALLRRRFVMEQIGSDGQGIVAFRMTRLVARPSRLPAVPKPGAGIGCA